MILVTGGTGLVGAHLLLQLVENGEKVRAIYRQKSSKKKTLALFKVYQKEHLFVAIDWIQADIIAIPSLENAFLNIDQVYHCAAFISYDPNDEIKLRKTNIEGTANIVNLCIEYNIKKLCHVSSIAALGDLTSTEKVITEQTEWNPEISHSDYAISKYGAEMEIWRGQQEGLNVIIVNPGIILGPGFWQQGSGIFFSFVKKGLPFYTNGTTGYVGVTDVVKIMIKLMNCNIVGERFSLVSENLTFKEVIFKMTEYLNAKNPKIEANYWMLSIAWKLDWLLSLLFRVKRKLSKYTANALLSRDLFSNEKITNYLNFEFQNIDFVIKNIINLEDH